MGDKAEARRKGAPTVPGSPHGFTDAEAVFGDRHRNAIRLGERDRSIQRRQFVEWSAHARWVEQEALA